MKSIVGVGEAEGAATSQDADFDPTAPGARGVDTEGTRNELAKDLGVPSLSENATLSSVSSLNTEINDPKFGGGSSDTSDIEGFTSDNVDAQVQIENALPLSGLPKELQEDIKRQLEGRGVVHSKSVYRKEMSDTFDKEHSLVRKDLRKEVLDNIESFTNILKPLDKSKAEEQSKKPMFTKHLEILTTIEDGGNSEDKTTFVYREGDPANVFTAMFGVTTTTANRVFKALKSTTRFGKGDTITKAQASVVVNHIRNEALADIEKTLKDSTLTLSKEQKEVLVLLAHNVGKLSVKTPSAMKALKRGDLQAAKIEFFSRAKGPNNSNGEFVPGLFKKNNTLLGLFERFGK